MRTLAAGLAFGALYGATYFLLSTVLGWTAPAPLVVVSAVGGLAYGAGFWRGRS